MRLSVVFLLLVSSALAQIPPQQRIRAIAATSDGKVSVACALPGSSLNCDLNPHAHPPMQSVFKLPTAVTTLHMVEQGKLSLDQSVRFLANDRILPQTWSPLQDKYPQAEVDVPLRELLRLAMVESDNTAADIILRTIGGPAVVDAYIQTIGVSGFHLQDNEHGLHRDVAVQYRNWFEPAGAVQLLRRISDNSPLTPEHTDLLFGWMKDSTTGAHRIKGQLPAGTIVMHKTGSAAGKGIAYATNDIGLIILPDGRRLAIAVFITDSKASDVVRDSIIARIARAAYDEAVKK